MRTTGRIERIRRIVLPGALAGFLVGLRTAAAVARLLVRALERRLVRWRPGY